MAKLFVSHSSKDKDFVRELADDLRSLGHDVWLDEWEIKVGDCIISKVEAALSDCSYVVLVMSRHAVESGWVEKEWRSKYWEEVQVGTAIVLPVLLEDCEIPLLLKTKKYADFRTNHRVGFAQLAGAIQPIVRTGEPGVQAIPGTQHVSPVQDITVLLTRVHSADFPLSRLLAEALGLAHGASNPELAHFCELELHGYGPDDENPNWRFVSAYVSVTARINPQYIGFKGNASAAFDVMASDSDFMAKRVFISFPVPELERRQPLDPTKNMLTYDFRLGDLAKNTEHPDTRCIAYMHGDAFTRILTGVRTELSKRLVALLPPAFVDSDV